MWTRVLAKLAGRVFLGPASCVCTVQNLSELWNHVQVLLYLWSQFFHLQNGDMQPLPRSRWLGLDRSVNSALGEPLLFALEDTPSWEEERDGVKWPQTDLCPEFLDKNPNGGWAALPLNFSPCWPPHSLPPSPLPVKTNRGGGQVSCCFSSPAAFLGGWGDQLPPVGQMLSEAAVCLH